MEAQAAGKIDGGNCSGGVVIIAGVAGKRLSLKSVLISTSAAANVLVRDESGTVLWPSMYLPVNGGISRDNLTRGRFGAAPGTGIVVKSSSADVLSAIIEAYLD